VARDAAAFDTDCGTSRGAAIDVGAMVTPVSLRSRCAADGGTHWTITPMLNLSQANQYPVVGEAGERTVRSRWLAPVFIAAIAGLLGVLAPPAATTAASSTPSTLRAAFSSFPDYMDPQLSYTTEGWTAMYDTYIPLLAFRHANGRAGADVVPGLAESLPKITDGGRTYTLFLRQGLEYSDGTPVRASDFEYAVERLFSLNSGGSSFYTDIVGARRYRRTGRGGISGILADDRTGKIVIHLVRPRSTFTDLLALIFAAPVPPGTPMRDQTFTPPPATGPYAITHVDFRGWSYARNPAWESNDRRLLPQLPDGHVERIEVRVIRNADTQLRQIAEGKLDWMQGPPPARRYAELRRKWGGTRFRAEPTLSTSYFWMNTTKPPFSDLRVREAANYAIDPAVLRRIYGGELSPSQQILPPGMPGYRKFVLFPHNLAKARRLVAAADPSDRDVTVWTDTEPPQLEAAAYYRSQLQKIGLHAHLKVVNADDYFFVISNPSTPNLDTGWSNWFADYPHPDDFFRPTLLGSNITTVDNGNFSQIDVPALNAKIDELNGAPLDPALERGYAALDRSYMKRAPWAPFGNLMTSTIVSKAVDLGKVVWNPLIGTDLTSFQLK
jgi:peptide/nickel transport system substrate-binding protein